MRMYLFFGIVIMMLVGACSESTVPSVQLRHDSGVVLPPDAAIVDAVLIAEDWADTSDMAQCLELHSGDVFKVERYPSLYIMTKTGEYMYFPDVPGGKTSVHLSWRYDTDPVCPISQASFDKLRPVPVYPVGVNYHFGSYVVKRAGAEQLYVVEPGNTRAKITAEAARVLYGKPYYSQWGADDTPIVIPDAQWPNLVNFGADISEPRVHPGLFFTIEGDPLYPFYVDEQYVLHPVWGIATAPNHLQAQFLRSVPRSACDGLLVREPIRDLDAFLNDPTQHK